MIDLDTSEAPIASILVLNQDNLEMLGQCLASIGRTLNGGAIPYEVIVLFQQTSRKSADAFLEKTHGVKKLHASLNLGFGGGNNFAARIANGKYLVFLNDDATVQDGWLEALVRTAEGDGRIGAVGSRILFPDGTLQEAGVVVWSDASCHPLGRGEPPGSLAYSYLRDVDYASANGLLVRRTTFDRAGGFDQRFFPGYYEDVDLCLTIRHELGERVVYEPRSVIAHRESATANRDPNFRAFLFQRHQARLVEKWGDTLASYPAPQPDSKSAVARAVIRARGNPKQVLVVDDRVPRAGLGSGFGRTADLLNDLSSAGYAVTFLPSDRGRLPLENPLAGLGIDLVSEPLVEHLRESSRCYDIVILSRPHNFEAFYPIVRSAMPNAAIIYDVEALYHRRLLLQANQESDSLRRAALEAEADRMQALEETIARSADRLVAISESELEWLESVPGHAHVHFLRPLADDVVISPVNLEERTGAVFAAGWLAGNASPNVDALRWYVTEVLPRVRAEIPNFVTSVSGANPPLSVQSLARDGVELIGFVESTASLYSSPRVAIAPILAGAGVKIKTIEALQYGVPVVGTTVGAEGLGLTEGEEIDIADDAAVFADRIIALLSDDSLWLSRRNKFTQTIARWESERVRWREVVQDVLRAQPKVSKVTAW
jgi:GT2 family glycosyltransferase